MTRRATKIQNLGTSGIRLTLAAGVCLASFVAFAQEPAAEAAKTEETKTALPVLDPPKSVFVSEPREMENKKTRDPFFPKSVRRDPIPKGPTAAELAELAEIARREKEEQERRDAEIAAQVTLPPDPFDDLELKGVIGGSRPMATIFTRHKNYLFSPGEWRMVKVPNVKTGELREVHLECVSIEGKEVAIRLETKPELRTLRRRQ